MQKQRPEVVCKKRCSQKFHRKTPVPESFRVSKEIKNFRCYFQINDKLIFTMKSERGLKIFFYCLEVFFIGDQYIFKLENILNFSGTICFFFSFFFFFIQLIIKILKFIIQYHRVKGPYFPAFRLNTDQKNSKYGYLSRSVG